MHTMHDQDSCTTIHYNPDLSGEVIVVRERAAVQTGSGIDDWSRMRVPGDVLLAFVLDRLRERAIQRLEDMTTDELLAHFAGDR